jgi:Icc-related predicted phosphoesterase
LITSDLHQHLPKWKELANVIASFQPQHVLVCGDLLPKDGLPEQRRFFKELSGCLVRMRESAGVKPLLFLGNDDFHVLEPLLDELESEQLCLNLNGKVHRQDGLVFCGMNRVRDYPYAYKHWCVPDGPFVVCPDQFAGEGMTVNERGDVVPIRNLRDYLLEKPSLEDELNSVRRQLKPDEMARSVWMVHQPPAGMGMDLLTGGIEIGSPTINGFVLKHQPLLGCSGHAHESPYEAGGKSVGRLGKTLWLQAGQLTDRLHYATAEITESLAVCKVWHSIFGLAEGLGEEVPGSA